MLGLNLAKSLERTSWLRILPNTTSATRKKQPYVLTTSASSTTPPEPPQPNFWEPLDTCLQRNGAMEPFHSLFDQGLLDADEAKPKHEGITNSAMPIKPFDIGCPHDTTTFQFEDFDVKRAMKTADPADSMLEAHQNIDRVPLSANEKPSSLPTLPSLLSGMGTVPFHAMFPDHLLLMQIYDIPHTNTNNVPVLEANLHCRLDLPSLSNGSEVPFHKMLGSIFTRIQADGISLLNEGTLRFGCDGRTSPQLSTTTGEYCSSLSDGLHVSRRSSWATSISTQLGDDDDSQSGLGCVKLAGESDHETYDELIHSYQHYCELIDVGDPQNCRNKDFSAEMQGHEGGNGVATGETATQAVGSLADEAKGDTASDDSKFSITYTESVPREQNMQSDDDSALNDKCQSAPPSTPAEAAAWAHSYCDADPESAKLKILTDDRGREYVLYHDCFHCVPIEMAPEFVQMAEEDDGYVSAPETCEAARDGMKLGTIQEDENES